MGAGLMVRSVKTREIIAKLMRMLAPATCMLAIVGCANHSDIADGTASAVTPIKTLPVPDPRGAGGYVAPEYYIGPLDKLDIVVFQVPELTRTVQVDPAGRITLPFAGTLTVNGKTTDQVRTELAGALQQSVLQNPEVSVSVSEAVSQRVTLEGALTQPGLYPVAGKVTLLQAIAMARGTTNVADERYVAIFRTIEGQRMAAVFDLKMIRQGQLADPEVYGNDVVVVERSKGKVLVRDIIGTAPLLALFRPFLQ